MSLIVAHCFGSGAGFYFVALSCPCVRKMKSLKVPIIEIQVK